MFQVAPSKLARGAGVTCSTACRNEVRGFGHLVRAALPGTVRQIAERTHVEEACVRDLLGNMVRAETCHVASFELNTLSGHGAPKFSPVLALGPSPDPDMPKDMRAAVTRHTSDLMLSAMPLAIVDIAAMVEMPPSSVGRLVRAMHLAGKCHVGNWRRAERGAFTPIYHAGPGKDVPCRLKILTQAQKDKRRVKKIKDSGLLQDWTDSKRSYGRARYWEKKAATVRDPMLVALFGAPKTPQATKEAT